MSISKRILFERHPEDDEARAKIKKSNWDYVREFTFRLPCRRKGKDGKWDPCWPSYLARAAEQLDIEFVFVNEGMFFRLDKHRTATLNRAKQLEKNALAGAVREHSAIDAVTGDDPEDWREGAGPVALGKNA